MPAHSWFIIIDVSVQTALINMMNSTLDENWVRLTSNWCLFPSIEKMAEHHERISGFCWGRSQTLIEAKISIANTNNSQHFFGYCSGICTVR